MLVHMAILPSLQEHFASHAGTVLQITFGISVLAEFQISEKSERKISFQLF